MMIHFLKRQLGLKSFPAEPPRKKNTFDTVNSELAFLEGELIRMDGRKRCKELEIQWLALLSHYARLRKSRGDS
jgi:hypothetical protein